jgi:tetratricopeptide (TPR) repeat protein
VTAEEAARRVEHLRELGRFDDAERTARKALLADPDDPELLAELSAVLFALDRHEEGLAAAEAALAGDPDHEWAYRLCTDHLSWLDRHDEAVERAERTVARCPDDAAAHHQLARVLRRAGHRERALGSARQAVELDPEAGEHHLLLADIASDLKRWRMARRAYHEALRIDPTDADARHNLAVLDSSMMRFGPALRGLVEAGSMDPHSPLARENLTALLWKHVLVQLAALGLAATAILIFGGLTTPRLVVRILAALSFLDLIPLTWWLVRAFRRTGRTAVLTVVRTERGLRLAFAGGALGLLLHLGSAVTGLGIFALGVLIVFGVLAAVFVRFAAREAADEPEPPPA